LSRTALSRISQRFVNERFVNESGGGGGGGERSSDEQLWSSHDWNTHFGREHLVDNAVVLGLFGGHEKVAITIIFDFIHRLSRVVRNVFAEQRADEEDFLGLDLDVGSLALQEVVSSK